MTTDQITVWIKEAHENAVAKGFYDCPECEGTGTTKECRELQDVGKMIGKISCNHCNGTGIDPNKNIGELLMLIISELGEALEAHRKGKFAEKSALVVHTDYPEDYQQKEALYLFEHYIKETFEDEIADVFIRLFDLCGYLGIDTQSQDYKSGYVFPRGVYKTIGEEFLNLSGCLAHFGYAQGIQRNDNEVGYIFSRLESLCLELNIPIEKHIEAKMAYNRTRPHKHGKEY